MYSIFFVDPHAWEACNPPRKVYITLPTLELAQHYWDILSKANFYMVSTRP